MIHELLLMYSNFTNRGGEKLKKHIPKDRVNWCFFKNSCN